MTTTKNSVKLVWCAGIQVPENKVAGRLMALARGRQLKSALVADQAEEDRLLKEKGYSSQDISCLRHANRIARLENAGFGTSTRCRVGSPKC